MIQISAIICTLNRAPLLRLALASLARQTLPREAFEVLVVDNGSTDDTAAVVAAACAAQPNVRLVVEATRGLSHARNTGVDVAQGAIVAFLDDDAEADAAWLAAITARFAATPRPACVGGPIAALWDAARPRWLSDGMLPYLTVLDWRQPAGPLQPGQYVAGANMAFDRDALRAVGGFPTSLGRVGTSLLSNEEVAVERALAARGGTCWWDPAVRVGHHMQADRLTRRWFLRRYYWQGVSDALTTTDATRGEPTVRVLARAAHRLVRAVISPAGTRFGWLCEGVRELAFARHRATPVG